MKHFDVVIVGAGPAGGQSARLLAKAGYKVLLIEQHENFEHNDFSSAATPIETLEKFDLPEEVVGSFWQEIAIVTTNVTRNWKSPQKLGAVFNFAKLREFLAKEVEAYGGEVWLGCRYIKYEQEQGKTLIFLKHKGENITTVSSKIIVDATGFTRAVIYKNKKERPPFLKGTGIEYLIEVEAEKYNRYSDSLTFFLGYKWMPKGYSWIFPMERGRLKVGAACINAKHKIIQEIKPLKYYIHLIIEEYLKLEEYKIIDVHGSILEYSSGLNDLYYQDNIVAVGDAVSTVNFLGGEGIRHAMHGAEIACKYIEKYLHGQIFGFEKYQKEMQGYFKIQWNISEKLNKKVYLEYSDEKIDRGVANLTPLTTEDMINILFHYKFEKAYKLMGGYLRRKIASLFSELLKGFWKIKLYRS